MLPSPAELRYFLEISNTLNLSRAAERLGISQPTLSISMQRLEELFGTPLLIRSKSGVQLTQAGQKLVTRARGLLEEWDQIRAETLRDETEIRGQYIIGCHSSIALYTLPTFMDKILLDNPFLEIKLIHDLSRKITEDVINYKVDFGIVVNPWQHPDLVIRPLYKEEVSLWISSKPSPLQDPFSGIGVLICDTDLVQSQYILKQLNKHGMNFRRIVTSSSLEVITSLVAGKAGVGILPKRVAQRIKSFGLRQFHQKAPSLEDRICLIYRSDLQKSIASRKLVKAIEKAMAPDSFVSSPAEARSFLSKQPITHSI